MERIKLIQSDITLINVDAIVNAANSTLLGGGGVDGAIHLAAGPELLQECKLLGGCKTGEAKITKGYHLPAKFIIHTVGPVWDETQPEKMNQLLGNCYLSSLKLAVGHGLKSLAFPNISTGIFGYPKKLAAKTAIDTVREFLEYNNSIEEVTFVCFDVENYHLYARMLDLQEK